MARFDTYNPFVDRPPEWPFRKFDDVASRALRLLRAYTLEELRAWAAAIDEAIEWERTLYVEIETDRYVERLVSQGGWELGYLNDGDHPTETNIRWLLRNWPNEADDLPDLPSEDDVSDIEALQSSLDSERFQNPIESHHFSVKPEERWWDYQDCIFGLLALMKVEEALNYLGWQKNGYSWRRDDMPRVRLEVATDLALDAVEAIGVAEKHTAINLQIGVSKARFERAAAALAALPASEVVPPTVRLQAARERGRKSRTETYALVEEFVKLAWREQISVGNAPSEDDFVVSIKSQVAERFKRRSNSKGGNKGEGLSIATSSILRWIRNPGAVSEQ